MWPCTTAWQWTPPKKCSLSATPTSQGQELFWYASFINFAIPCAIIFSSLFTNYYATHYVTHFTNHYAIQYITHYVTQYAIHLAAHYTNRYKIKHLQQPEEHESWCSRCHLCVSDITKIMKDGCSRNQANQMQLRNDAIETLWTKWPAGWVTNTLTKHRHLGPPISPDWWLPCCLCPAWGMLAGRETWGKFHTSISQVIIGPQSAA